MSRLDTSPYINRHKYARREYRWLSKYKGGVLTRPPDEFSVEGELNLYVIFNDKELLYVGESPDCVNKLEENCHSWSHRHKGQTLDAHLFVFHEPPGDFVTLVKSEDDEGKGLDLNAIMRRTIESEVTYEIRKLTDRWPTRQHEIHFYARLMKQPFIVGAVIFVLDQLTSNGLLPRMK